MPSKQFSPSLPDVVPERYSRVLRCYAEHLEGLGLSAGGLRSGSSGTCSRPGGQRCRRRSRSADISRCSSGISWKSGDTQAR